MEEPPGKGIAVVAPGGIEGGCARSREAWRGAWRVVMRAGRVLGMLKGGD